MKNSAKTSRPDIRRMIALAAWNDKRWVHAVSWSSTYLQRARGYVACMHDLGLITLLEVCEYEGLIDRLILKINKMI